MASPAPWKKDLKNGRRILAADGTVVAMARATGPVAWEDADLIEAAPELLAVARRIVQLGKGVGQLTHIIEEAKAATAVFDLPAPKAKP